MDGRSLRVTGPNKFLSVSIPGILPSICQVTLVASVFERVFGTFVAPRMKRYIDALSPHSIQGCVDI